MCYVYAVWVCEVLFHLCAMRGSNRLCGIMSHYFFFSSLFFLFHIFFLFIKQQQQNDLMMCFSSAINWLRLNANHVAAHTTESSVTWAVYRVTDNVEIPLDDIQAWKMPREHSDLAGGELTNPSITQSPRIKHPIQVLQGMFGCICWYSAVKLVTTTWARRNCYYYY